MADQPPNQPEKNEPAGDADAVQGFSQDDIDAALAAANAPAEPAATPTPEAASPEGDLSQANQDAAESAASGDALVDAEPSQANTDAAMGGRESAATEAPATMAAAIEEDRAAAEWATSAAPPPPSATPGSLPPAPEGSVPIEIPDFARGFDLKDAKGIGLLNDVQLDVRIELGRSDMYIEDVLKLGKGAVVELDRLAGDPVDVIVNEKLVARGEVLVLNDNFCVRISEILVGKDDV